MKDDTISRQAAIDAAKHAWAKGLEPSQYIEIIPPAQPKPCESDEAAKRLNDLISDINPWEICSQIESDNLINWCKTIQSEMKMAMVQLPCLAKRRTDERTD